MGSWGSRWPFPSHLRCRMQLTKPLKVEMMKKLDNMDLLTRRIGAVNTVAIKDGLFIGYNTDDAGFTQDLRQTYGDFSGRKLFVFGAGGVSRAICFSAAGEGADAVFLTDPIETAAV